MQRYVWALVALLVVLHQDNWFWEDDTLVFGFMPVGLFYHACISVSACLVWLLAVNLCWPTDREAMPEAHRVESPSAEQPEAQA